MGHWIGCNKHASGCSTDDLYKALLIPNGRIIQSIMLNVCTCNNITIIITIQSITKPRKKVTSCWFSYTNKIVKTVNSHERTIDVDFTGFYGRRSHIKKRQKHMYLEVMAHCSEKLPFRSGFRLTVRRRDMQLWKIK